MTFELRPWRISDTPDLAAALNNPHVLDNLRDGLPFPYTPADGEAYIRSMLDADPDNTFARAIVADGKAVGSIGAFRQSNIHFRTAELGYYLAEPYWGRGIMTAAVRQLCAEIFDTTDILRIFAEPFSHNTGSRRVLEKAGFQYEGLMRQNAVKNGRVVDMALYALTRPPFTVRRLTPAELPEALTLIWRVFSRFEAPEYADEGIREFRASLDDFDRNRAMDFYGAFEKDALLGVLAMRQPRHIGYFFVDGAHHGRGVGRALYDAMRRDYGPGTVTVNSSPFAVEIYRHLGFVPTGEEQTVNGLHFTPMRCEGKEKP